MIKQIYKFLDKKWLIILVVLSFLAFIINILLFYPGFMSIDSMAMYNVAVGAKITDLVPVISGSIWRLLINLTGQVGSMLIFQLTILWLALGFLAVFIYKKTKSKLFSFLCLAIGGLPFIVNISGVIWKDNHMAFSLFLAVVLTLYLDLIKKNKNKVLLIITIFFLITFSVMSRYNAIFAVVPIVFLVIRKANLIKKTYLQVITSIMIIPLLFIVLIPLSNAIVGAVPSNNQPGLLIDDIVEVSSFESLESADISNDLKQSIKKIKKCSAPSNIFVSNIFLCADKDTRDVLYKYHNEFQKLWLSTIMSRPFNYIAYKLKMTREILVPTSYAYYFQDGIIENKYGLDVRFSKLRTFNKFYVTEFGYRYFRGAFEPLFWLLSSIVILYLSVKKKSAKNRLIINVLCISSILYIVGYIPTGVAPEFRYIYWNVFAIILALILFILDSRKWPKHKLH